jgi:hypothetical protein
MGPNNLDEIAVQYTYTCMMDGAVKSIIPGRDGWDSKRKIRSYVSREHKSIMRWLAEFYKVSLSRIRQIVGGCKPHQDEGSAQWGLFMGVSQ